MYQRARRFPETLSVSLCTPDLIPSQRIWWIWGKVILAAAVRPSARQLKSSISTMYRALACSGRRQVRVGWLLYPASKCRAGTWPCPLPTRPHPSSLPFNIPLDPAGPTLPRSSKQKSVCRSGWSFCRTSRMCLRSSTDPQRLPLFPSFFHPLLRPLSSQPLCALTDSDRCACARAARCIHRPKPESYRCSGVPNKLSQLTRRCHQCELEKRWICSIPQRCYFDTHALHMLSGDQQADFEREKTADGG